MRLKLSSAPLKLLKIKIKMISYNVETLAQYMLFPRELLLR